MTDQKNLTSLKHERAQIKEAIFDEKHRPRPDSLRLTDLKKQNLWLKEKIERLTVEEALCPE